MDTRYRDRGYSATLKEEPFGAFLTIKRNDGIVGEVAIGIVAGGPEEPVGIVVKRFRANELRKVSEVDDFHQ